MNKFIQRSIIGTLGFLKASVFTDEYAGKNGFLQSIDPRIKTLSLIFFVISALLIKNISALLYLYSLCLLLALFSKIRLGFFLKRTWIFMPLFSLFITLPALFSAVTPGEPIVASLGITRPGLFGVILFVTRVITCVSFAILLSLTTRHTELLKVLRILRIPQVFVMTLGICYRYIYLFVEMIENAYLSIKSRVGISLDYRKGQNVVAWKLAHLWQRSLQLNEEVYSAMLSRGYSGEPRVLDEFKSGIKDWAWLFCAAILGIWIIRFSS